ncbi:hypothetical protein BC943DRAFT_332714 [Umbelopsis sp. AD052]|nr:hypothetical protein BC943DRAFT_332714 [Umbelopsis sp. AD052]
MSASDLSSTAQIQNTRRDRSSSQLHDRSPSSQLHDRPPTISRHRSGSLLEPSVKKAHTVVDTFKLVFQDEPEVLDARTVRNVERTRNQDGKVILRTVISVHYVGHADKQWPSWPWSKSPVMHEEMPPEMKGLYSEDLYRDHLQASNQILRRYLFNRYPKMLLTLLFILLIIFIIVIRTLYVWKTVYFAWIFAFALVFLVLLFTMRIRAWIGLKKLKKLEREWNEEGNDHVHFEFDSIDFLYFVRLFITVESQDKITMDAAQMKYLPQTKQ